ncbi:hypothetical protein [Halobacillus sp. A5]|uniref:hypothetical protein n=1 Tax=Halobacillus sp. A5 TaxID=2880263 RepID=UPI0020A69541|nr:hypothetical protein [Halobacillus sp. A5]MCP3027463.1 hypothetical protein [Halobacillus sp. A5]
MPGPESELPGFQSNPNNFGKCSSCGVILTSKKEAKVTLCKDCQDRHKAREEVVGKQ